MSDMGVISTKLHCASKLLEPYVSAMDPIHSRDGHAGQPGDVQSLLDVLVPLDRHLRGISYYSLGINGRGMSEFLRLRHSGAWPDIRNGILSLTARLEKGGGAGMALSDEDVSILDDVADALDNECEMVFRETRRR